MCYVFSPQIYFQRLSDFMLLKTHFICENRPSYLDWRNVQIEIVLLPDFYYGLSETRHDILKTGVKQ